MGDTVLQTSDSTAPTTSLSTPAGNAENGPTEGATAAAAPGAVPDGGLDAYMQVVGSWVVLASTWGVVNSFGVFQAFYEESLLPEHSASEISWIGSLQAALLMTLGTVSGPLYDAGYFRETLWLGLFLICFGQFMTSLCRTFWQVLLAQGVCVGLGCGLVFLPSTAILSQYFARRRSLVIGMSSTGSPIGGMLFPIIFGQLERRVGFGWATRVMAFILLAIAVVPLAFMRVRLPPMLQRRSAVDWDALRDFPFMLFTAGTFFGFLGLYVAFFYIQLFAVRFDISSAEFSPYFVTFLSVGSIPGRLLPPYAADAGKRAPINIMLFVSAACAVLCYGWTGIRDKAGLVVFALLYGCFSGAFVSVLPSAIVSLSVDMSGGLQTSRVGTHLGMAFFVSGLSILIGTPVAGAILGGGGEDGWSATESYAGSCLLLCAAIYAVARYCLHGRDGRAGAEGLSAPSCPPKA